MIAALNSFYFDNKLSKLYPETVVVVFCTLDNLFRKEGGGNRDKSDPKLLNTSSIYKLF